MGKLELRVVGAKNLGNTELVGTSDPYCVVSCEGKKYRTTTKKNDLNPQWNEKFTFMVADPASSQVHFEIFDHNLMKDDKMGHYSMGLAGLEQGKVKEDDFILRGCKKGTITIRVKAVDFGDPAGAAKNNAYPQPGYPPAQAPGYPPVQNAPGFPPGVGGAPVPAPAPGGYPPVGGGYPPAPGAGGYPPPPSAYPPQNVAGVPGYPPGVGGGYPPAPAPIPSGPPLDNRTNIRNDDINTKTVRNATINTCDIIDCVLHNCNITKADFKGTNTLYNCTVREIDIYGAVHLREGGRFEWGEVKPGGHLINEGGTHVKDIDNYHGY